MIKVIATQTIESNTTTHVSVYSGKNLSEAKALSAAKSHLRGLGFEVTDLTFDPSTPRSAMVSAYVR